MAVRLYQGIKSKLTTSWKINVFQIIVVFISIRMRRDCLNWRAGIRIEVKGFSNFK